MLHVGAVKRVLGDHGQRVEHREFIAEKEGAELLSNSTYTPQNMGTGQL